MRKPRWISISIPAASGVFILALAVAAVFDPSVRLLHVFQALIYVTVIYLTRQDSDWGYGAGSTIAGFWNYIFLRGASPAIWAFLTGRAVRPDIGLQLAATLAHFLLIAACVSGFLRSRPGAKHWIKFLTGGVLAVSYLLLLVVLMRPQVLPMIERSFGM